MNKEQHISSEQSRPTTSAGAWGLRHSGLVMGKGGRNEVKEFSGMWRLKPDADLVAIAYFGRARDWPSLCLPIRRGRTITDRIQRSMKAARLSSPWVARVEGA